MDGYRESIQKDLGITYVIPNIFNSRKGGDGVYGAQRKYTSHPI